uniref:Integrase catalytic domain-containing protein n=2 Tax=Loa loa TaxID=7209 RepID=A0A1I7VYG8_LOALO
MGQFWSSFDAAVHSQTIPDIQKLNYFYSCLKEEALQAVSGYEIAPENYGIIRQLLKNKYGDPSTIASTLYRELQSFKQNEKEWMITIENIERVLRQLEALGDNLEHPSIETIIESKMPPWILNKVYTQRKIDKPWTIQKLRNFLSDLVEVNQQVKIDQYSNFRADNKPTTIKGEQKRMYRLERISALSTMQTNHRETRSPKSRKRPCIFCSRDHWDSDCDIYSTVKGRMKRLKTLKKCTICLKDSHQGETCKAKKRCFYCKASHNSALCEKRSTPTLNITTLPKKQESIYPDKKESSQLSFISKKLSSQLQLAESDHRNMLVAPFGTKGTLTVSHCQCAIEYMHVEYLTQEIQVVDIPVKEQCEDLTSHWDKPDILIGADCFFKFVDSQDKKELRSGYIMVHSKVGPMITGEGYIDELCNSKGHSIPIICSVYTNPNSELEKFWRLEMIGIHESPTEDDDERAIDHFNKTIIKLDGRYQRLLIRQVQSQSLTMDEKEKWSLFKKSPDNLWRSWSRLGNSELTEDSRFPIYLPKGHHLTNLIILHQHERLIHAGITHTLSELRQKFWIPKGRAAIKSVLSKCMVCKRWKAKPFKLPAMPNLPESRVRRSRAFENVGLDYLGPITLKAPYGMIYKRWIALFTCFTTRAVHLELAEDLSGENFSHVLRRFTARRGFPKLILSDNASQFQLVFKVIAEQNSNFLADRGMIWRNIIPKAPWGGGVYERIIGLTKQALKRAVGRKLLKEGEFITLIVEIEALLNTRPLTYVGFDDYRVIRPIDFISPTSSLGIPIVSEDEEDELVENRKPRENEIVLLAEPNIPRGIWKLAKIVSLKEGRDGSIRRATVQLPNGRQVERSVNQLCPMEVNETCELDETESERSITNRIQEVTDSPTNYNKVKGKEIEVTDGPIASRTRKAQQQSTPAGNTVKDNSTSLTKALFVMTILSLMSIQAIATKNCNWTSGIPFNIPERWSCDNKTNHTMINLNCGFNNSYLMKGNIILDVNKNIDDKSTANLNQTQETTKRLLLMEISLEEITKEEQQLANQLGKELDQVKDSIQEKLKNIVNHWKLITICIDILVISIVLIIIKLKFELFKSIICLPRRQNSRSINIIILPTNLVETHSLNNVTKGSVIKLNTFSYSPEELSVELLH